MKTLLGWIVGVFALGLFFGSFHGGDASLESTESDTSAAPFVECGPGTQAVIVPGTTPLRIRCIATARPPAARPVPEAETPSAPNHLEEEVEPARSAKESALIIGGAAGAGAGIGAIAKGKKGAALGAAIGGVAGAVYDLATRNPKR
jgi:hypothetical protein